MEPEAQSEDRNGTPPTQTALEDRVRELESALAAAKQSEDALAERVMEKLLAAREAGSLKLPPGELMPLAIPPLPQGATPQFPGIADRIARRWLLFELWTELRLLPQMYFDPRYRLSRTGQFAGPVFLVAFLACYFLFPILLPIPVLGPFLERFVEMLLAISFYKVMVREAIRYRGVLDYLEKYGYR